MIAWLRRWISGALVFCVAVVGAWWFAQQTDSWRAVDALVRRHAAVRDEVGKVQAVRLPLFGWSIDWTDARIDPEYDVRVSGTEGVARVHVQFHGDAIADAWMITESGGTVPLLVAR